MLSDQRVHILSPWGFQEVVSYNDILPHPELPKSTITYLLPTKTLFTLKQTASQGQAYYFFF